MAENLEKLNQKHNAFMRIKIVANDLEADLSIYHDGGLVYDMKFKEKPS